MPLACLDSSFVDEDWLLSAGLHSVFAHTVSGDEKRRDESSVLRLLLRSLFSHCSSTPFPTCIPLLFSFLLSFPCSVPLLVALCLSALCLSALSLLLFSFLPYCLPFLPFICVASFAPYSHCSLYLLYSTSSLPHILIAPFSFRSGATALLRPRPAGSFCTAVFYFQKISYALTQNSARSCAGPLLNECHWRHWDELQGVGSVLDPKFFLSAFCRRDRSDKFSETSKCLWRVSCNIMVAHQRGEVHSMKVWVANMREGDALLRCRLLGLGVSTASSSGFSGV